MTDDETPFDQGYSDTINFLADEDERRRPQPPVHYTANERELWWAGNEAAHDYVKREGEAMAGRMANREDLAVVIIVLLIMIGAIYLVVFQFLILKLLGIILFYICTLVLINVRDHWRDR